MALALIVLMIIVPCSGTGDTTSFILDSKRFPDDDRFAPPIGNGYLATNVFSDAIYVDGVFNGHREDSHRARIPSTASIRVTSDVISEVYRLDMWNGVFIHKANLSNCEVEAQYFAHRLFPNLLIVLIKLMKTSSSHTCLNVHLQLNTGKPSADFRLEEKMVNNNTRYQYGPIVQPETNSSALTTIHHYWTHAPKSLSLKASENSHTFKFITSVHTNKTRASHGYSTALAMSADELYWVHSKVTVCQVFIDDSSFFSIEQLTLFATTMWQGLWKNGKIDTVGGTELQQTINACFYHILSSIPSKRTGSFHGLSPGGLSRGGKLLPNVSGGPHNDYAGHVFWDMDTWVMPPIMMFYPDMARTMIGSRLRVLPAVKERAKASGYEGAQFPWEQAITGYETCPWKPASDYQIHVTADVGLSLRHYFAASSTTRAIELLDNGGKDLALEIARFWKSRAMKSTEGDYVITGVMGPDEYHFNINNSVFTNYNAKLSMELPDLLMKKHFASLNQSELDGFLEVSNKIRILYDQQHDFHPQFDGFSLKEKIKQSDVVLLGFPLQMPMSRATRRNDLEIYENVTDRYGPDTGTWSMHTVGWLELGEPQRAYQNFKMMFRNINGPFKVFSEKPANSTEGPRCVNFITGAGGLLQAVVFGYGGLRLTDDHLEVSISGIPGTSEWAMNDLKYRGFTFDLKLADNVVTVNVSESEDTNKTLAMVLQDGYPYPLQIGKARETPNKAFRLRVMNTSDVRVHSGAQSVTVDILRDWIVFIMVFIPSLLCSTVVRNFLF